MLTAAKNIYMYCAVGLLCVQPSSDYLHRLFIITRCWAVSRGSQSLWDKKKSSKKKNQKWQYVFAPMPPTRPPGPGAANTCPRCCVALVRITRGCVEAEDSARPLDASRTPLRVLPPCPRALCSAPLCAPCSVRLPCISPSAHTESWRVCACVCVCMLLEKLLAPTAPGSKLSSSYGFALKPGAAVGLFFFLSFLRWEDNGAFFLRWGGRTSI